MSRQKEHEERIRLQLEQYDEAFSQTIGDFVENGAVLGVPEVSPRKLRAFFNQVSPMEWYAATIADPEGALGMIQEYADAQAGG